MVSGFFASSRKLSKIDRHPAVNVVVATKHNGVIVAHANFARPALMITVVPTHNAIAARSWFAMPNSGQIVEI